MDFSLTSSIPSAVRWHNDTLSILDQRKLPGAVEQWELHSAEDVITAIRTLAVRGAPAIGIAGAYGLAIAARTLGNLPAELPALAESIADARPTAVNLRWAVERCMQAVQPLLAQGESESTAKQILAHLTEEACAIHEEDRAQCQGIARHGMPLIKPNSGVLTHCNAGALAVSELGTATAPMYAAQSQGRNFRVYSCETRPLLQGARLTVWELQRAGIDVTLICDSMAASLMAEGLIDAVIVGTDRVTANGDVVNKIGTLNHAITAQYFGIPFYVACPWSTFDPHTASGADVTIEERDADEVRQFHGQASAPAQIPVRNPAFDVTPAKLVTGLITDRGLIEQPLAANLAKAATGTL